MRGENNHRKYPQICESNQVNFRGLGERFTSGFTSILKQVFGGNMVNSPKSIMMSGLVLVAMFVNIHRNNSKEF